MEVDGLIKKLSELSRISSHTIKPHASHNSEESWKEATKMIYDFIKKEEKDLNFPPIKEALPRLHIKNMNSEQVWQQLEFQNSVLISDVERGVCIDDSNLCVTIASLCNKAREEEENVEESEDEGVEMGDDEWEDARETNEKTSDLEEEEDFSENEASDNAKQDVAESEMSDAEEKGDFSDFSDLDADTFGDIVLEDDDDDDDVDENDREKSKKKVTFHEPSQKPQRTFNSTSFDTQFLNLRESEWIADNDTIGKAFNDEGEKFDFMKENEGGESDDDAGKAMYSEFFDTPNTEGIEEGPQDTPTEEAAKEDEEKATSRFDELMKRETVLHDNLAEEYFVGETPWVLKGEVQKEQRPENSALEEHLEYTIAIRPKPIITEDTTKSIEKLILSRIRSQAWDDVERRVKPNADPFQFKKKLILDQEKSQKSLATIYEEEFIKNQEEKKSGVKGSSSVLLGPEEKVEELPIHKEIRNEMDDLFTKLDALSNYHYTPRYRKPEIKVVSNMAAVTIEESTPMTASDATLLAPQEIVAPLRGELIGETEKTSTDKNRQRRAKKMHQRAKAKKEEQKLAHQLKKKTKHGLLAVDASVKVVQKAFKKGQIKTLESSQQSVKSSTQFFSNLQSNMSDKKKKRKFDGGHETGSKKKKSSKELTIAKLLL